MNKEFIFEQIVKRMGKIANEINTLLVIMESVKNSDLVTSKEKEIMKKSIELVTLIKNYG